MANEKIRSLMREFNIPQWKLAAALGKCENTVQRMLRIELPEADQEHLINVIKSIKQE